MDIKETEEYTQREIAENVFQSLLFSRIMRIEKDWITT